MIDFSGQSWCIVEEAFNCFNGAGKNWDYCVP